jgi:hypothetical protein
VCVFVSLTVDAKQRIPGGPANRAIRRGRRSDSRESFLLVRFTFEHDQRLVGYATFRCVAALTAGERK